MTARKFTAEQEQEICRRYEAGESAFQLKQVFSAPYCSIASTLKRHAVKIRSIKEAKGGLSENEEAELCRRYLAGENTRELARAFGNGQTTVSRILKRYGISTRSPRKLSASQEVEVCNRYLAGENTYQIGEAFKVNNALVSCILKRNGIETRGPDGYGDSIQHVLDCTGHHAQSRECSFYLYELARYNSTHCKVGIAFNADRRATSSAAQGEYGTEVLRLVFATRAEAYLLEQAVLDATRGAAECPDDLREWGGASEVRAMPADDLLPIIDRLAGELEAMGPWAFAAAYVPMTTAQRATCQQRAFTLSPLF